MTPTAGHAMRWLIGLLVLLAPAIRASIAEVKPPDPLGAGGVSSRSLEAGSISGVESCHGWVVLFGSHEPALLHLPPRRAASLGSAAAMGVRDGSVRIAVPRLPFVPALIGACEDRLYLVEGDSSPLGREGAKVWSIRAVISGVPDFWTNRPRDGFDSVAALPRGFAAESMSGTAAGPLVLGTGANGIGSTPTGGLSLLLLTDDRWREVSPPHDEGRLAPIHEPGATFAVVADERSIAVVRVHQDSASRSITWWRAPFDADATKIIRAPSGTSPRRGDDEEDPAPSARPSPHTTVLLPVYPAWERQSTFTESSSRAIEHADFAMIKGDLMAVERGADGTLALRSLPATEGHSAPRHLWSERVVPHAAAVPLGGSARLAVLWNASETPPASGPNATERPSLPKIEVREVSALSGRVLYSGPAIIAAIITRSDYTLIVMVLLGVTTAVLAFVMRRESSLREPHLPVGVSLAEPGRRLAASAADFILAAMIAGRFGALPLQDAFSAAGLLSGGTLRLLGSALLIAIIMGTLTEWLFARTIGKWIFGCAVISTSPHETQPPNKQDPDLNIPGLTLTRALKRNLLKWLLAPFAVVIFITPNAMHPADRFAQSSVVVRIPDDDDDDEE